MSRVSVQSTIKRDNNYWNGSCFWMVLWLFLLNPFFIPKHSWKCSKKHAKKEIDDSNWRSYLRWFNTIQYDLVWFNHVYGMCGSNHLGTSMSASLLMRWRKMHSTRDWSEWRCSSKRWEHSMNPDSAEATHCYSLLHDVQCVCFNGFETSSDMFVIVCPWIILIHVYLYTYMWIMFGV